MVTQNAGQTLTTTMTRDTNDGQGGCWVINGITQPVNFQFDGPATGTISAEWKVQGTYLFKFHFQGNGPSQFRFPIIVNGKAASSFRLDSYYTTGTGFADNGFGAPMVQEETGTMAGLNSYASKRGELLYVNASGTDFTYETPLALAEARSYGYNASAIATIDFGIQTTNKSISIANSASPLYKAGSPFTEAKQLTFPNSSSIRLVNATSYMQDVIQPVNVGVGFFEIGYEIARPWAKKIRIFEPVGQLPQGNTIWDWVDYNPNVPFPFSITHIGSVSPMGAYNPADHFLWDGGSVTFSPPWQSVPGSPTINRMVDYVLDEQHYTVYGNSHSMSEISQGRETIEYKLSYDWGDGIHGQAIANYNIRAKKYDVTENLFSGDITNDLEGWKPLTDKMPAGHFTGTVTTTLSSIRNYVVYGENLVSLVACTGNVYLAGLAAICGQTAAVVTNDEVQVGKHNNSYNKVYPGNWQSVVDLGNPPSVSFNDHIEKLRWQTQLMMSTSYSVDNTMKFYTRGFQGTAPRYTATRDLLQGTQRTVYWLAAYEGDIPANWWTSD